MKVSAASIASAAALSLLFAPAPAPAVAPAGRYTASGGVVKDNKTGLSWQQVAAAAPYGFTDAVAYCSSNVAALPGQGWHLPTIKELHTLIDNSVAPPGTTIDANVFMAKPAGYFWSATPSVASTTLAWYVDFSTGSSSINAMTAVYNVRCVH